MGRVAALTPLGQLSFFIDFLKTAGLFEAFVRTVRYVTRARTRPRRATFWARRCCRSCPDTRDAHIAALRGDGVVPELLGMKRIVSGDAVRRAFAAIEEVAGAAWLRLISMIARRRFWPSCGFSTRIRR